MTLILMTPCLARGILAHLHVPHARRTLSICMARKLTITSGTSFLSGILMKESPDTAKGSLKSFHTWDQVTLSHLAIAQAETWDLTRTTSPWTTPISAPLTVRTQRSLHNMRTLTVWTEDRPSVSVRLSTRIGDPQQSPGMKALALRRPIREPVTTRMTLDIVPRHRNTR